MKRNLVDIIDTVNHRIYNRISKDRLLGGIWLLVIVIVILFAILGVLASVYAIKYPPTEAAYPWK